MAAKVKVCEEAIQLYDYMVDSRDVLIGDDEDLVIFKSDSGFEEKYKIWLEELIKVGWVKSDIANNSKVFVLGGVKTVYFRDNGSLIKEKLLSRYDTQQLAAIERALKAIGSLHKSGTLTEKQILAELKYFDKYSCEIVIKSIQVYLNLPIAKQHGERYLRGIVRNEDAQSNGRLQESKPFASTTSPIASHIEAQNKNDWVRSNIDRDIFVSMSNNDQEKYIRQLESDYDSTRGS